MRTGSEPATARSALRARFWLSVWGLVWAVFGTAAQADTFNVDVKAVARAITAKTRALVPVSLFGLRSTRNANGPPVKKA